MKITGERALQDDCISRGHGKRFGLRDISDLVSRTGIKEADFAEALGHLKTYRLHQGLLQRSLYVASTGSHEWLTVIPDGDWRTVSHGTGKRRLTLRRFIVLTFHCSAMGPHRSRDRTMQAIMDAGMWWSTLYTTCQQVVRSCVVCASAKATPLVTGHQRSKEYDGPFRYLVIDFVGPMTPTSARGNKYMFTCACGWSGWYWAIPCPDDTSETAARCLFYHVICDMAGYPTYIGSDRAKAFTEGVVKQLIEYFDITHILGTAYHPMSQSAVERPHREYNTLCKTFMENDRDWDLIANIFVWTIRTAAKVFNGMYTPYEIITGLKPRSPLDAVLTQPSTLERVPHSQYVRELVSYLKNVHKVVETHHARVRDEQQTTKYRQLGPGTSLAVGDYVLVRKEHDHGVSYRFQDRHFDEPFQIVEAHGAGADAKVYTVSNLRGSRDNLGFTQPVALERLTPIELLPLAQVNETEPTRIRVDCGGLRKAELSLPSPWTEKSTSP